MPLIPFPNVPNVPGVPVLLRSITVPTPGALFNLGVSDLTRTLFGSLVWGVLNADGSKAIEADSFVGIQYSNNSDVATYPMEAGAFASYNKTANPYDCAVTLAVSSGKAERTSFLAKLEKLVQGLDLLSVVTPEAAYANANLKKYDYTRTAESGLSMIVAKLYFTQIRQTAKSSTRSTLDPSGADSVSSGQVQIVEPTEDQIAFAEGLA